MQTSNQVVPSQLLRRALTAPLLLLGLWAGAAGLALASEQPANWQQVKNPAPVVGLDGRPHAAACSGYPGTDPTFSFWHKRGKSKSLVVYFEGGGACWDNFGCTFPINARLPAQVPQLYSEASAGVRFADWTAALLKNGGDGDGASNDDAHASAQRSVWQNAACPGCLSAIPCPPAPAP